MNAKYRVNNYASIILESDIIMSFSFNYDDMTKKQALKYEFMN